MHKTKKVVEGGSKSNEIPGETVEPCRRTEVWTSDDALGHQKLCTVQDDSWNMTKEEHDDNANKNSGQVHLVVGAAAVAM